MSSFPEDADGTFLLRTDQLELRRMEIYRTYAAFCALVKDGVTLPGLQGESVDLRSWITPVPLVRCDNLTLAGHSFGGCTVVSGLSSTFFPESEAQAYGLLTTVHNLGVNLLAGLHLCPLPSEDHSTSHLVPAMYLVCFN